MARLPEDHRFDPSRRRVLRRLALGLTAAALVPPAELLASLSATRSLSFLHTHTGEHLSIVYYSGGGYVASALDQLNELLRDHRSGEIHSIDPALFDLLHEAQRLTGSRGTYQVISGYRSPKTNSMLRKNGGGVARKSLHMQGQAIDVRLTDVSTHELRAAALELERGGVGYYAKSDFVHLDTGRVRRW
jgi:uncharacterized protein YcbK (DUF882 family)